MTGAGAEPRTPARLVVLQSVRPDAPKVNPYVPLLFGSLADYVDVVPFSWRSALAGPYDVLHVHWPEGLYASPSPLKAVLKKVLTVLLLLRLRGTGRPVVQTLHNVAPHISQRAIDKILSQYLASLTVSYIALNRHTPSPRDAWVRTVPHGHYKDWLSRFHRHPSEPHRVLFFGIIRRYKNVVELIRVVEHLSAPSIELHVVGYPAEPAYCAEIERAAHESRSEVRLTLEHLDDSELVSQVTKAQLVVLPYSEMHNSGALLFALSLDRPVLVPRNPVTQDLAAEVGDEWVLTYDPPLAPDTLRRALERTAPERRDPGSGPELSLRSWEAVAEQTAETLQAAARNS